MRWRDQSGARPLPTAMGVVAYCLLVVGLLAGPMVAAAFAEQGAGDRRAYLDPATGLVTRQRPAGVEALELSAAEVEMLSTSDEGLLLRRAAGNHLSVDLQGRFRHMSYATLGADGKIESHCVGAAGTPSDNAEAHRSDGGDAIDTAAHGVAGAER